MLAPRLWQASSTTTSLYFSGDFHDPAHVGHIAAQMNRNNPPGSGRDGLLDLVAVDIEILAHIHEHRFGAHIDHCRAGRHESMGRDDDSSPGPMPAARRDMCSAS